MTRTGQRTVIALAAAMAGSYACGATSATRGPTTGSATIAATDARDAGSHAGAVPVVSIAPPEVPPWVLQRDADGTRWTIAGPVRARVTDANIEIADDLFAASIVAASPVANGWVFVASDGAVAGAESFLGTLHRLGNIPRALDANNHSHGRLAVLDDHGTIWQTDGTAPIAEATGLPEGRCRSVTFNDASHGIAVMDGGRAVQTDDGGQSWHALDLGADAALAVVIDQGQLALRTTRGTLPVAADGSLGAPVADATRDDTTPESEATDWRRLRVASARRFPAIFAVDHGGTERGARWAARGDGNFLLIDPRTHDLHLVDGTAGSDIESFANAVPAGCADRSSLATWGQGVALFCHRDDDSVLLFRIGDGHTFVPAAETDNDLSAVTAIVFSDDGRHAVRRGGCAADSDPDTGLCALQDDGRWHVVTTPASIRELVAMHDTSVLVRAATSSDADPTDGVLDLSTGTLTPVRISRRDGMPRLTLAAPGFTTDGKIYGLGQQESASPSLLMGDPAQPLTAIALPAGAWGVGFRDSLHGVAAGINLTKLWRTSDGGRSWSPVSLHLDGSAESVSLRGDGADSIDVRCDAQGCSVGELIRVRGWDSTTDSTAVVIAATQRAPARMRGFTLDDVGISYGRMRCEAQGRAAAAPRLPPGVAPAHGSTVHSVLATTGASARMDSWTDAHHQLQFQLAWRGEDAHGAYRSVSRAGPVGVSAAPTDAPEAANGFILRGATRQLALVERCLPGDGIPSCVLLAMPNGGAPVLIHERSEIQPSGNASYLANTIAADDGGFLALVAMYAPGFAVHEVLLIAPDGHLRGRRALAWDTQYGAPVYAVGRYRNQLGYVAISPAEPQVFRFYAFGADVNAQPIDLPRLRPGAVAPCTGPAPSDAAQIITTITAFLPSLDLAESSWAEDVRAMLELSSAGECLRTVESWVPSSVLENTDHWAGYGIHFVAGPDGVLTGARDDGAHRQPLHCH